MFQSPPYQKSPFDLIAGLARAFLRPQSMATTAAASQNPMDSADYNQGGIWEYPPNTTPPSPPLSGDYKLANPQDDWFQTWDIQPAPDARYLPEYPDANDNSISADIKRDWHNSYADFARNMVQTNFPDFTTPEPDPNQSYHDYISSMMQPLMQSGTMRDHVQRNTNPGNMEFAIARYEDGKPTPTKILYSSDDNWASEGTPESPPIFDPDFEIKPGEHFPSPQQIWDKMAQAESMGLDPYEALGYPHPQKASESGSALQSQSEKDPDPQSQNNAPYEAYGSVELPRWSERIFGNPTDDIPDQPPYPPSPNMWPKDSMPPSPFDPNLPHVSSAQTEELAAAEEEYGPPVQDTSVNPHQYFPKEVNPLPSAQNILVQSAPALVGTIVGGLNPLAGKVVENIGNRAASILTEQDYQRTFHGLGKLWEESHAAGNHEEADIWRRMQKTIMEERHGKEDSAQNPNSTTAQIPYLEQIKRLQDQLPIAREIDRKNREKNNSSK